MVTTLCAISIFGGKVPLVHVQAFARHADIATTMGYVHKIDSPAITSAMAEALA